MKHYYIQLIQLPPATVEMSVCCTLDLEKSSIIDCATFLMRKETDHT